MYLLCGWPGKIVGSSTQMACTLSHLTDQVYSTTGWGMIMKIRNIHLKGMHFFKKYRLRLNSCVRDRCAWQLETSRYTHFDTLRTAHERKNLGKGFYTTTLMALSYLLEHPLSTRSCRAGQEKPKGKNTANHSECTKLRLINKTSKHFFLLTMRLSHFWWRNFTNLQWFSRVWTLIHHDLCHHNWSKNVADSQQEPRPRKSIVNLWFLLPQYLEGKTSRQELLAWALWSGHGT